MIRLTHIHKYYSLAASRKGRGQDKFHALDDINLAFRDNEFVAILGPSGSGKTTLLNIIGGLDHYDEGDLIINGISTKTYNDRDWDSYRNHSIGFIFQSYNLIMHQTVCSNVELALTISGIKGKERHDRAVSALEKVGLGDHVGKMPNQLSGGQMQRVAIARALVNNPSVLLADEPTGALDSNTSLQVMDLLKEVAKDRLVIMVTHNPDLAEKYADRIITLKDGRITGDSNPVPETETNETLRTGNMGHSSMSLMTSTRLSLHNLWSKRKRTFLTAFAGSIGIIGIGLILALSTGVNDYIQNMGKNMLYSYPLQIQTVNLDVDSVFDSMAESQTAEEDTSDAVKVVKLVGQVFSAMEKSDLGDMKTYLDTHPEEIDPYVSDVEYTYSATPTIFYASGDTIRQVNPDSTLETAGLSLGSATSIMNSVISTNAFYVMPEDESLYKDRYDVKAGRWPENSHEMVLVLNANGGINDYALYMLGVRDPTDMDSLISSILSGQDFDTTSYPDEYSYDEILGRTLKLVSAADLYQYDSDNQMWTDRSSDEEYMKELMENAEDLTLVGIVQPKEEYGSGALYPGINYPYSLMTETAEKAAQTEIVQQQLADPEVDVFTGQRFDDPTDLKQLDFGSLVSVDAERVKNSIIVDSDAISQTFLDNFYIPEGSITAPEVDISQYVDSDALLDQFTQIPAEDMLEILESVDFDAEAMKDMINELIDGYLTYLSNNGIDLKENYYQYVYEYFQSDRFIQLVVAWGESLGEDGVTQEKAEELSGLLISDLEAYLAEQSIPSFPDTAETLPEYLQSEEAQTIINDGLAKAFDQEGLQEAIKTYVKENILSQLGEQLQTTEDELMAYVTSSISSQMNTAVTAAVVRAAQATLESVEDNISIDSEEFLNAFSFKLSTQELASLLMSITSIGSSSYANNLEQLGYADMDHPDKIQIYALNFEGKEAVIDLIDRFNAQMQAEGKTSSQVSYTDTVGNLMTTVTQIVNIISYSLIAAVAISLVVSSIMIGVITYISVLERRKEIGILRAMGASKRNISQVFNAETALTGLLAGLLGIVVTYLLLLVFNPILRAKVDIVNITMYLPAQYALLLVIISVALTMIGGLIPARSASHSDPVAALRNE